MKVSISRRFLRRDWFAVALAGLFASMTVMRAQNHNPEFKVSDTFLDGEPYIFIGDDDAVAYPSRTPVELKYRDGIDVPKEGTVTLHWVTTGGAKDGSSRVLANDSEGGTGGVTDGEGKTSVSGPWTWVDDDPKDNVDDLEDYSKDSEGNQRKIYLQGVADTVDPSGNVTSNAGDTVSLEAKISGNSENFSKDFELLKVDLIPHWPNTIENSFDKPAVIDEQNGSVIVPGQTVPLHEVDDRDNVYLVVNNDNDDRDTIPADPSSNYPDDRIEASGPAVLKHDKDDDAVMVRIAFSAAENMDTGTLDLRTGSTTGIDSRIRLYHASDRNSDGVLLTPEQLSIDLANPDASNPLKPLADGEEVKIFIEGAFALEMVESVEFSLYLTLNGTETKLSDFTLKLLNSANKSMRFVAHSSVGSAANNWTRDRMQDSSNLMRRDDDFEGNDDRIVAINFTRRETIPIDDGNGSVNLESIVTTNDAKRAEIEDILRKYNAQCYVTNRITDAGGFSMDKNGSPLKMLIFPYDDGDNSHNTLVAHEWLHAFADLDHESCLDKNLMVNQSEDPCESNPSAQIGPYVTETQKDGFINNDS